MGTQCWLWNEWENHEKTPGYVQEKNTLCSLRNLSIKRETASSAWDSEVREQSRPSKMLIVLSVIRLSPLLGGHIT